MIARLTAQLPARHIVEDTLGFAALCVLVVGAMCAPGMI